MLTHAQTSYESYITCCVPHNSSQAPLNFLLPQIIPNTPKTINERQRRKQEENHGKPTTIQHHKQSGIALHQKIKIIIQEQQSQKTKSTRLTKNTMTQSQWFLRKAQPKPSSEFHGIFLAMQSPASCCHKYIIVST